VAVTLCTTADAYRVSGLDVSVVTDAEMTEFILDAEGEIKTLTNKWWGSYTTAVEYFNRRKSLWNRNWPKEIGYLYSDTSDDILHSDYVLTSRYPIHAISRAYILIDSVGNLEQVWSLDQPAAWTDNTTEANTVGGTAFNAFAAVPVAGDILYIGNSTEWEGVTLLFVTPGVDDGTGVLVYEYWNGAAWTALTDAVDSTSLLTADGIIAFSAPRDWATTAVNGVTQFYIRIRITVAGYTTAPTLAQIYMNDEIDEEINTRDIKFYSNTGKMYFPDNAFRGGLRDLKVRYTYGTIGIPRVVEELCASLAALRALTKMMGGSYDDVTSYSVPDYSASKGEPYTNMRATIIELHKKIYGWSGGERGAYDPGLLRQVGVDIPMAISGTDSESEVFE